MIAKFLSKHLFWVLQFVGWGSFALIVVFAGGYDPNPTKAMVLFLPMTVFGVLSSSFLRWILKTKVGKYEWGIKKVFAIILANILSAILLFLLIGVAGAIKGFTEANEKNSSLGELDSIFFPIVAGIGGVALFLSIWTIFYYGIKYLITYNKGRLDRLQLKEAVKSAQLKTLKGHIHPQFLATSLKNINELMSVNISQARFMLTGLSELLRYSLTKNDETPVTLENEVKMVQKYRQLLALEATTGFILETNIPKELCSCNIPPMILLKLIILGSKYSIPESSSGKKLRIGIIEVESSLRITVTFNGILKPIAEANEIQNSLKKRLSLLYGILSSYDVRSFENDTAIEVRIPSEFNRELNTDYGIN